MAATAVAAAGCKSTQGSEEPQQGVVIGTPKSKPSAYIPKAVIYRTNGDYAQQVPIALNAQRTAVVSYPGPGDVSEASSPVALGDGWLLDRRGGVGLNSAFLRYTYAEYARLQQAPSAAELMSAIIPEARVTEVKTLPITLSEALADPAALKEAVNKATR